MKSFHAYTSFCMAVRNGEPITALKDKFETVKSYVFNTNGRLKETWRLVISGACLETVEWFFNETYGSSEVLLNSSTASFRKDFDSITQPDIAAFVMSRFINYIDFHNSSSAHMRAIKMDFQEASFHVIDHYRTHQPDNLEYGLSSICSYGSLQMLQEVLRRGYITVDSKKYLYLVLESSHEANTLQERVNALRPYVGLLVFSVGLQRAIYNLAHSGCYQLIKEVQFHITDTQVSTAYAIAIFAHQLDIASHLNEMRDALRTNPDMERLAHYKCADKASMLMFLQEFPNLSDQEILRFLIECDSWRCANQNGQLLLESFPDAYRAISVQTLSEVIQQVDNFSEQDLCDLLEFNPTLDITAYDHLLFKTIRYVYSGSHQLVPFANHIHCLDYFVSMYPELYKYYKRGDHEHFYLLGSESLPVTKAEKIQWYVDHHFHAEAQECIVCNEQLPNTVHLCSETHIVCKPCLTGWFERSETCPMCRAQL